MTRSKRTRTHISSGRSTAELLRESNQIRNSIRDMADETAADLAHVEEVNRLLAELQQLPATDPMHIAARRRLDLITGKPYGAGVKFRLACRGLLRRAGDELIVTLLPVLRVFLILLFNLIGLPLILFLFLWLLSLL